jgi:hypothetical protein
MNNDVIPLLMVHEYFRGVSDEVLQEVSETARVTYHRSGAVVHEANAALATVGFVLRGRLKAVRVDANGVESFFRMIERGEQFGMMVGAVSEPVPVRVIALEATTVLGLDFEQAMDRPLLCDGRMLAPEDVRRQAAEWHDATRIIFDVGAGLPSDPATPRPAHALIGLHVARQYFSGTNFRPPNVASSSYSPLSDLDGSLTFSRGTAS